MSIENVNEMLPEMTNFEITNLLGKDIDGVDRPLSKLGRSMWYINNFGFFWSQAEMFKGTENILSEDHFMLPQYQQRVDNFKRNTLLLKELVDKGVFTNAKAVSKQLTHWSDVTVIDLSQTLKQICRIVKQVEADWGVCSGVTDVECDFDGMHPIYGEVPKPSHSLWQQQQLTLHAHKRFELETWYNHKFNYDMQLLGKMYHEQDDFSMLHYDDTCSDEECLVRPDASMWYVLSKDTFDPNDFFELKKSSDIVHKCFSDYQRWYRTKYIGTVGISRLQQHEATGVGIGELIYRMWYKAYGKIATAKMVEPTPACSAVTHQPDTPVVRSRKLKTMHSDDPNFGTSLADMFKPRG